MKIVAISALLAVLTSACATGTPAPSPKVADLEAFAKTSQESRATCEAYAAAVTTAARALDVSSNPAAFRKLLALAGKYPGTPEATKKGIELAFNDRDAQTSDAYQSLYPCVPRSFHVAVQSLARNAKRLKADPGARAAVVNLAIDRMQAEHVNTLIDYLVHQSNVNALIDENFLEINDSIYVSLYGLDSESRSLQARLSKNSRSEMDVQFELDEARRLTTKLTTLVKRAAR